MSFYRFTIEKYEDEWMASGVERPHRRAKINKSACSRYPSIFTEKSKDILFQNILEDLGGSKEYSSIRRQNQWIFKEREISDKVDKK